MKIKDQYVLKKLAGKNIVVPIKEEAVNFNGIITLNETSVFLFERLKSDATVDDLIIALTECYEVDIETAKTDILSFIDILKQKGMIDL
jgi:hypothetical protein